MPSLSYANCGGSLAPSNPQRDDLKAWHKVRVAVGWKLGNVLNNGQKNRPGNAINLVVIVIFKVIVLCTNCNKLGIFFIVFYVVCHCCFVGYTVINV